jgi:glycine cleavage system H protein
MGITDYAQSQLGDVVFLELPKVGTLVKKGDSIAVVESVKAASDIYAPLSGKVVEVNQSAADSPEMINSDPFDKAWLVKLEASNTEEISELLSSENYDKLITQLS